LIGVLPLVIERHYGRVPVRYVQNWRHHHQFLGAPLVQEGKEEDFWRALLGALDGAAWAPGFLHLRDLPEDGRLHMALITSAAAMGRPAPTVYRETRAFLQTSLSPDDYYSQTVRKKKRKELARLRNRLAELGSLTTRRFSAGDSLSAWCDAYLKLEQSGWKGQEGSALACRPPPSVSSASLLRPRRAAGCNCSRGADGRPIAMLVNSSPPGSFSFKTAFDELMRASRRASSPDRQPRILDPRIRVDGQLRAEQHR
jgi:hypothetical protein